MKKIINLIRSAFRCHYRLTVHYCGDPKPRHCYSNNGRMLRNMANNIGKRAQYITLYKQGPFGLPEREVYTFERGE